MTEAEVVEKDAQGDCGQMMEDSADIGLEQQTADLASTQKEFAATNQYIHSPFGFVSRIDAIQIV